jgi:hypothetical protein
MRGSRRDRISESSATLVIGVLALTSLGVVVAQGHRESQQDG